MEKIYREVSALHKDGKDGKALAKAKAESPMLATRDTIVAATKGLADLNRERDRIYADRTMTPEQKRIKFDELQVLRNKVAKTTTTNPAVRQAF